MFHKAHGSQGDGVSVYNRLDKVVVEAAGKAYPFTPADARAMAENLRAAADTAEKTPDDGATWQPAEGYPN